MSVKLRRGIYHADVVVNGQRVRVTTGTGNKAEALKFERELRYQVEAGTYSVTLGEVLTLRRAFDKALNEHWLGKPSEHTAAINATAVCGALGDNTPLASVDSAMLWKLKTSLKAAGNANATVNRKLSCIHTLLTLAYRSWGVIKAVPYCPQEPEHEGRLRILSAEEEAKGLGILADAQPDMAAFFTVLVDTGLRLTEGLNIGTPKATEIDYMHRALRVWKSKGGKPRSVPMTERVYNILWDRRALPKPFPFSRYQADEAWQEMKKSQGITDKDYCIHALRHTFASRLVQRGVPLYVVQKLLGHASITTTERYAHLAPENMRSAIDALENWGCNAPLRVPLGVDSVHGSSSSLESIGQSIEVGSGSLPLGDSGSSGETRGGSSPLLGTLTDQEVNTPIMPVDTDDASK